MQSIDETEDGEISDEDNLDVIEPYEALERPCSLAPIQPLRQQTIHDTDESSDSSTSSSDSSSCDERNRPAKRRKKIHTPAQASHKAGAVATKRNPWSAVIFEDHIEKELKGVNVQQDRRLLDQSREVESYFQYGKSLGDRLGGEHLEEERNIQKLAQLDERDGANSFNPIVEGGEEASTVNDFEESLKETRQLLKSRKRKMDERGGEPTKPRQPKNSPPVPTVARVADLSVTTCSSAKEVAKDIAVKLHEDKADLILRVVEIIGIEQAIQLFEDTRFVENEGGIPIANGTRRRTPGGVFLYLLRNHQEIPMEQIRLVFEPENKEREKKKKFIRAVRRQEQTARLKQSLSNSGHLSNLPPLPSRVELEMQTREQQAMESETANRTLPEENDDEDQVLDIHFDLE